MEGLEETVERLKAEGVKVTLEPKTLTADGNYYRIAFIEDPDGYKIELVERGTMKVGRCSGRLPEDGSREVYLEAARRGAVEVVPEDYSYVFNPYREPIARVEPGQRVKIHTEDAFESRIQTPDDLPSRSLATAKFLNPQTGPIYVEGAEPGDTLAVRMENIEPKRDFAVSCFVPFFGGLTSTPLTRTLQEPLPEKVYVWNFGEDDRGRYLVNDEIGVSLPWEPFVGTIAVAPDLEAISALSPGPFGGNMDVPDVRPGNTVYLPVWNEGALFYTGDCHARQGQGELCGVALEITAEVTVTFEVIKGGGIEWPRIESEEKLMTVGSARPMEDAARIAYAELIGWLVDEHGFSQLDAYQLLTQAGGLYVGNMVDTTYSLVASIEKRYALRHP